MQEQSYLERSRSHVIEKLPVIMGVQRFGGLHLHDHAIVDDEIHSVPRHNDAVIEDWNQYLASD